MSKRKPTRPSSPSSSRDARESEPQKAPFFEPYGTAPDPQKGEHGDLHNLIFWRKPVQARVAIKDLVEETTGVQGVRLRHCTNLLCHLLAWTELISQRRRIEGLAWSNDRVFIPLPDQYCRHFGGRKTVNILTEVRLIEIKTMGRDKSGKALWYNRQRRLCAEFSVASVVLQVYWRGCLRALEKHCEGRSVAWCDFVRGGFANECEGIERSEALESKREDLVEGNRIKLRVQDGIAYASWARNVALALGDRQLLARARRCVAAITSIISSDGYKRHRGGLGSYTPTYKRAPGGRLYELGGGLQGAPRELKQVLTSDLGYQNWDMRASHHVCAQAFASVLNQSARLSDRDPLIPCDVTHKTREMVKKGATKRLADELGVPVGLLKACRLAMLYGGKTGFGSAIYKACEEHVMSQGVSNIFGESRLLAKRVEQAHESLTELADSLISITRRLVEEPWFLVKKINRLRRCLRTRKTSEGIEVVNAVGGALLALDKSGKWLVKAESVFSHIITGIEQDFINNLIKASAGSNFHVLSYEHDGLLTTGQMPPNALKNAQKASLLANYAEIDIKPFIKPGGDPFLRALAKRSASPAEDESMVEVPMPGCLADYFEFHRGHEK